MYSFGCSERIMGISIISYGKNSLDLRPPWVTTSPRERIEFVSLKGPLYIRAWLPSQALRGGLASQTRTCMGIFKLRLLHPLAKRLFYLSTPNDL
jgi:hypothetical protein